MWAMILCGLSYGSKVLVYDGSPFKPDPLVTFRLVEKLK
jgi:acetoacetyl-CoA synthetase